MGEELKVLMERRPFGLTSEVFDPWWLLVALLASLASSLFASWLYSVFYERRGTGSQINRAFPLLGISITTLFVGVQVSLPLSLGLLGALSIIRFRTPIKEPEEVGFVMLVIASAITCATFRFDFLVILYLVAVLALIMFKGRRFFKGNARDGILVAGVEDTKTGEAMSAMEQCLKEAARTACLESCTKREGESSLQFSFSGLKPDAGTVISELSLIAGVKHVNLFFNRPSGLS